MTLRSLSRSVRRSTVLNPIIFALSVFLAAISSWLPPLASAQSQDQNKNSSYIHPPQDALAPKLNQDPRHPAPPPNSGPKFPFRPGTPQGPLPRGPENAKYKEDPDNLLRAWKNRRPMKESQKAVKEAMAMPTEANRLPPASPTERPDPSEIKPLSTNAWEQIGYGDFNSDTVHYQAGRIRQASYAYDNQQGFTTLWLGATGGGVWRAIDLFFAIAFVPVSDSLPGSPSVGAFLVQPGNSNNILIGSGDSYRYGGTGLYKTTDGGTTWNEVSPSDGTSWPAAFQKILIDLNDTTNQTVLAQGDNGIWRSTDFGSTWYKVYSGSTSDLVQDPVYTYIWYAGAPGTGVLRSTSYGTSFAPIGSGMPTPGRISVALSASATWHVYAISATTDSKWLSGIWRSDDYGDGTWFQIESTDHISGLAQAFHTTSINVDPNNADILFAGMAGSQVTYNATAAAPSWTYSGSFDEGHADHTGYVFEPGTTNVISTTDGGVYVLDEFSLAVSGSLNYATNLNVQQVFGPVGDLACSLNEPDECISGLQDNGSITINRNNTPPLVIIGGGDGNQASIAPDNPAELFQMGNGGREYSTDGGASWTGDYGNCLPNNYYATTMIDQTPPIGFTPYIYTFSLPPTGGTNSYVYYKTVNPNCDWTPANPSFPFNTSTFSPRSMDASNDPTGYVFYVVGWGTGRLYVLDSYNTGNLGTTMSYVDRTPPVSFFASFNDSQIAADRSSSRPYTVTYTTGAARPSQAFISNDRGQTWTEVTGDLATKLPDASFWKLIANPGDQSQLFLGTDQGIYRSDNGGVNWYQYMSGMPAVASIFGLELNYDYSNPPLLHLGTYGRGYWNRQVASDAVLSNVTVNPTQVVAGQQSELVVWLDRAAPRDITVSLTSSNPLVYPVPSTITVAQGYSNAGIEITTGNVTSQTQVTVTATYNQLSPSAVLTVMLAPTTTSVVSSLNPSNYGQAVTFTATVASTYGTPTGTVTFYDGSTAIGSGGLSGGHASFTSSALTGGTHSFTAKYAGGGIFSGSTSSVLSQVVKKIASTTTVVSSLNPSNFGQSVKFTATVAGSIGTPSGTVTFKDGAAALGTGTLSAGKATFTTSTLAPGTHSITAVYAGDSNFTGSTSSALSQVVNKAASTTTVTSSLNPSTWGAMVTFTATVKSSGGTPAGSVSFLDGTTTLATRTLSAGQATYSAKTLAVGGHSITAVYAGNADFNGSTSSILHQTVNKAASTTVQVDLPNPSAFHQAISLKATVKSSTSGVPTGSVTFKDGTKTLGTATLNTSGIGTLSVSTLSVGTHSLTAAYGGDVDFTPSTSAVVSQKVNQAKTTTTLTLTPNPSKSGQTVTFTATITPAFGGNPSGTVTFKDGTATLGTGTVSASTHQAKFSTSGLSVGTHNIKAIYGGDTNYVTSTSPVVQQIVNQ